MQAGARVKEEGLDNNLLELIAADPSFNLSLEELKRSMDPSRYVGRAPQQTEDFINEDVLPVLEEYKDELGIKAEIKV
jgi:adenylosuccinate lyase